VRRVGEAGGVAGCWSSGCRRPGFRAGVARRRRPGGLEGVGVSVPAGSLRVVRRALRMMRAGMLKRIRPSGGRGAAAVGGQPAMTRAAGRSYGSPSRLASAATGRSGTFHRPTTRREVAPLQDIAAGAVQVVVLIRVPGQQAIKIRGHLPLKIIGGPMSQQTRRIRFPMRGVIWHTLDRRRRPSHFLGWGRRSARPGAHDSRVHARARTPSLIRIREQRQRLTIRSRSF
jgi:hypothetical protein